jgi:hypothetical protein
VPENDDRLETAQAVCQTAKSLQIGTFVSMGRNCGRERQPLAAQRQKPCKRANYGASRTRTGDLLGAIQALWIVIWVSKDTH